MCLFTFFPSFATIIRDPREGAFVRKNMTTNPATFLKEVVAELKKVTWPTRNETIKLTVLVIVISTVVAAFIGGLDYTFLSITSFIFKR